MTLTSLVVLTPHEEPGCFTVTSILSNLPQLDEFVVEWDYPLMRVAAGLVAQSGGCIGLLGSRERPEVSECHIP